MNHLTRCLIGWLVLVQTAWACPILPVEVTDVKGNALVGASVSVYLAGTSTLATLYSDATCTVTTVNPATTSSNGTITGVYVQDGLYDILPVKTGYGLALVEDVVLEDPYTLLTPTYAATIVINRAGAQRHIVTATNTSDFAFNAPTGTHAVNSPLWVTLKNSSGGILGAITWNAVFKKPADTKPANGFNRSYLYLWDGSAWVFQFVSGADVPN